MAEDSSLRRVVGEDFFLGLGRDRKFRSRTARHLRNDLSNFCPSFCRGIITVLANFHWETIVKKAILILIFGTLLLHAQSPKSEPVKQVPRIYVAELHFPGNPDWDGIVRSKLISSLVQDCGSDCTVVEAVGPTEDESGDGADGVLTGDIVVQARDERHYRVQGAMRLVDKNGKVLWAATIYSSPFARSATSSFAENTAKGWYSFVRWPSRPADDCRSPSDQSQDGDVVRGLPLEGIQSFTDIVSPHCSGLSASVHLARIRDVLRKGVTLLCDFS